jgi:NAD(P)-dependent dehydrogenase (short-subunit alcohol dehydrogenase family)
MPKLAGKVALITGAAGGQGTAEAELFVREGAAVMLTDVDAAKGEALATRLGGAGGRVLFRVHDAASEAAWQEIVAATLSEFGALHILVNNAGTIARQGIVATTLEAWNRTIGVNLTGPLLGMKHCAPAIRDSGGGSIVNISSTAGLTAHDDAAYTASKWGLRGLTKTAVLQFSPWNIRVNMFAYKPLRAHVGSLLNVRGIWRGICHICGIRCQNSGSAIQSAGRQTKPANGRQRSNWNTLTNTATLACQRFGGRTESKVLWPAF